MAQAQFSIPSLQELLLTARTGADAGAGAIRSAQQGFNQGGDIVRQRRAAEIKAQLDKRGQDLKEQTLREETSLGQQRVRASNRQTAATEKGITTRAETAKAGQAGAKGLRESTAELNRAKADLLRRSGGKNLGRPRGQFITDTEIEKEIEAETSIAIKELDLKLDSLQDANLRATIKEGLKQAKIEARSQDIATFVGGTYDDSIREVLVSDETGEPGSIPPLEVVNWLKQNPKRKGR